MDLYDRALRHIPNCYKLWFNYLKEQMEDLGGRSTYLSPRFDEMLEKFENSLVYMHKMPNIWLMYADYAASLNKITLTRQIYDRALKSLPVTQHDRIWKKYCEWVSLSAEVDFEDRRRFNCKEHIQQISEDQPRLQGGVLGLPNVKGEMGRRMRDFGRDLER